MHIIITYTIVLIYHNEVAMYIYDNVHAGIRMCGLHEIYTTLAVDTIISTLVYTFTSIYKIKTIYNYILHIYILYRVFTIIQ